MTSMNQRSKMWPVVLAAVVIVVLAGSLGARLIARGGSVNVPNGWETRTEFTLLEHCFPLVISTSRQTGCVFYGAGYWLDRYIPQESNKSTRIRPDG